MANSFSISAWQANKSQVVVTGSFTNRHGSYNDSMDLSTSIDGGSSWRVHKYNVTSGSGASVSETYNVGTSASSRSYRCAVRCSIWGSYPVSGEAEINPDGNKYAVKYQNVTVPANVQVPPVVTNVSVKRTADNSITLSWTNNGSGESTPTANYVDVQIDDSGTWTNVSKDSLKTSYTYTAGTAGHKYQFRVNSYNAAGQNTHQVSNAVYTTPLAPTLSGFTISKISDRLYKLSMSVKQNSNYTSGKVELYYSDGEVENTAVPIYISNSEYTIQNGVLEIEVPKALPSPTTTSSSDGDIAVQAVDYSYINDTEENYYLWKFVRDFASNGSSFYIYIRVYNTDNSLLSSNNYHALNDLYELTSNNTTLITFPQVYVNLPDVKSTATSILDKMYLAENENGTYSCTGTYAFSAGDELQVIIIQNDNDYSSYSGSIKKTAQNIDILWASIDFDDTGASDPITFSVTGNYKIFIEHPSSGDGVIELILKTTTLSHVSMKAVYINVPNGTVSHAGTLYMDSDKAAVSGNTLTLNQASVSGNTVTIQTDS